MNWFSRLLFIVCRWLLKPVLWFVKPKLIPAELDDLRAGLYGKPVCYVLSQHSWSDRVVLEELCRQHQLPLVTAAPGRLPAATEASCLYLPALRDQVDGDGQTPLQALIAAAADDGDYPLQLVPVSIFWGRDPGAETSLFKLLLGDAERAGSLRKLMIMLVQGRHVLVNVAQPVDFRDFIDRQRDSAHALKVLHRMLSFHFLRQKTATLGPSLLSRPQMINAVLRRQPVREAIAAECEREGITREQARKRARQMAEEVAANFDVRALRFLDIVLSWVFSRLFSGIQVRFVDRLRRAANNYHVIYMPSHRSHLDYLLISYTLYWQGLVPPHIAAGVNLNFWPVGGLLRRGGAFYIRRSFAGQALYSAVFRGYLDLLMGRGYPVEFFPEGGRSRTGRLLPPKKGMLAMVVESFLQQPSRPAALVPVYVGYDKLVESGSYVKELRGASKKKESAGELLKARKIFDSSYGSPYVAFGQPLVLAEELNRLQPEWRQRWQRGERDWLPAVIDALALTNMERINQAVVVNPIGLVAMILLASPQMALAENELLEQIERFLALLRQCPYSADMSLPEGSAQEIFEQAARTAGLSRIDHDWGPIVTVTGNQAVMLTYYRNAVMHVLALPSLIARFFRHAERVDEATLREHSAALYPFLKRELFLHLPQDQVDGHIGELLDGLVAQGLLSRGDDGVLLRPEVGTTEYTALIGLGRILRETFERYTMTSLLLVREMAREPIARSDIERQVTQMAQRLAILSGREAPEYFDKTLFRGYLDCLIEQELLRTEAQDEGVCIRVDPRLQTLAEHWVSLLGPSVQQGMQQLLSTPVPAPVDSAASN